MSPAAPRHPRVSGPGRLGIVLPPGWRRRADPDHGVLVAARCAALPASGVRPELVVRWTRVDDDLVAWRARAMTELGGLLADFDLDDAEEYDLLGRRVAYRRFAHRVGTADVLSEQWAWLGGGVGVTLTCSCAREDYPHYGDVFEEVAGTVDLLPDAA